MEVDVEFDHNKQQSWTAAITSRRSVVTFSLPRLYFTPATEATIESTKVTIKGIVLSNTSFHLRYHVHRNLDHYGSVIPEFPTKFNSVFTELFRSNQPKLSGFNEVCRNKLRSSRTSKKGSNSSCVQEIR